jgi:hypothetical protein
MNLKTISLPWEEPANIGLYTVSSPGWETEHFYLSSAQNCAKSVLYEIIPTNLLEALEILEHLHGCSVCDPAQ